MKSDNIYYLTQDEKGRYLQITTTSEMEAQGRQHISIRPFRAFRSETKIGTWIPFSGLKGSFEGISKNFGFYLPPGDDFVDGGWVGFLSDAWADLKPCIEAGCCGKWENSRH